MDDLVMEVFVHREMYIPALAIACTLPTLAQCHYVHSVWCVHLTRRDMRAACARKLRALYLRVCLACAGFRVRASHVARVTCAHSTQIICVDKTGKFKFKYSLTKWILRTIDWQVWKNTKIGQWRKSGKFERKKINVEDYDNFAL
jgi:hypothetical protein